MTGEPRMQAGADTSSDKEKYVANDERLAEIKSEMKGDLSEEELDALVAERGALKSAQTEHIGRAQDEAIAEDGEWNAEAARKAAEAKAAEDAARAEQVAAHEAMAIEDAAKAAALSEQIKSGNIGISASEAPTIEPLQDAHVDIYKTHLLEVERAEELAKQDELIKYAKELKNIKEKMAGKVGDIFRQANQEKDVYTTKSEKNLIMGVLALFKGATPKMQDVYRSVIQENAHLILDGNQRDVVLEFMKSDSNALSALAKGPITETQITRIEGDYVTNSIARFKSSGEYTAVELSAEIARIKNAAHERYDNIVATREASLKEADRILEKIGLYSSDFAS